MGTHRQRAGMAMPDLLQAKLGLTRRPDVAGDAHGDAKASHEAARPSELRPAERWGRPASNGKVHYADDDEAEDDEAEEPSGCGMAALHHPYI